MLVIGFQAEVTRLIPLYTVGVFVSFTLSQTGMVRHWRRHLATETDPGERRRMRRAQAINGFGAVMTGVVLITVLITKFALGAWIAIAAMAGFYVLMIAIQRHYDHVAEELDATEDVDTVLPSRNHAIVLVARLHRPTLRAIAYARATRPDVLEAVTVNVDDADTRRLVREWDKRKIPVSLKVVESPYREITKPVLDYVKRVRTKNPRDVVTVFVPEYVVGHWWEQVLHNQSALRIKTRLLFQPGVMVVSVPWQLKSSERVVERAELTPGAYRRGYPSAPRDDRPAAPSPSAPRARRGARGKPDGKKPDDTKPTAGTPGWTMTTTVPTEVLDWTDRVLDLARRRGRARRALRRARAGRRRARACRVRAARAAGRAGARGRHRRQRRRVLPGRRDRRARSRAGPGRAAVPVGARRGLRGLRLAARRRADPARAEDGRAARAADSGWPGSTATSRSRSCHARMNRPACWGGGTGCGSPSTARAGPGCAPTAATTSCRSPTARSSRPGSCRRCWSSGSRRAARSRWRSTPTGSGTCTWSGRAASGPAVVQRAAGREWPLSAGTFWQVHPELAATLATVVGEWAQAPAGGLAWDLYGGVGLFAAVLAEQVGPEGEVRVVESAPQAVADGRAALADLAQVRWTVGRVEHELASLPGTPDVVVADPPRRGLGRATVAALCDREPGRGSCTSPATRPRWPATWPCSPRRATSWRPCARSTRSR